MVRKKKNNQKETAQDRYRRKNPTVSFRVTAEFKEQLDEARYEKELSYADLMKIALERLQIVIRDENLLEKQSYDKGLVDGLRRGRDRWGISFHCVKCGDIAYIEKPENKEYLSDAIDGFEEYTHMVCPHKQPPRTGNSKGK